jgi:ABC-2 type transport system ATP-binding protein/lipopolysaccharide transport system ATP-binding protein
MRPAISLTNVSKVFDIVREKQVSLKAAVLSFRRPPSQKLVALQNLDLVVSHGEALAVIGRNGSGKSTLLGIIGRIYKPTTGTVEVDGRVATLLDPGAGFHPDLTGRENIFFNGAIMGLTTAQVRNCIDDVIEFAELNNFIDAPVKTYSSGMLLRLGFSIAVQTNPDILLIDEAIAVGDAKFQEKCYERIESFKRMGKTIVFVTHDLEAARSVASRALWLDKGKVCADGEPEKVIDAYLACILDR